MKSISAICIALIAIVMLSCSKDEESIADCFGQSFLLNVHHTVSAENPRQVSFNVTYSGSHPVDTTVKWNFADGTPVQTVSGLASTHTYTAAGTYAVKATVTLNNGACSYDLDESVTVE